MSSEPNIVIFGCKSTTKFLAESIIKSSKIKCLITINRGLAELNKVADYYDLSKFAEENNVPFYYAKSYDLKDTEDLRFLDDLKIELAFVIGWQRLIPPKILNKIKIGAFGMHGSSLNLPLGRGRSPMNWAIIEGRKVFYTNLFKYDEGIDSGKILDTYKFSITEKDNAETMHYKNMLAMVFLINKNYENLLKNTLELKPQVDIPPTYYPKRNPNNSIINWKDDIYNIERFIRAVSPPFNGAFTFVKDNKIIILSAQIFDIQEFGYENEEVSTIVEILENDKFLVKCFGGLLLVNKYKSTYKIHKGDKFGNNNMEIFKFQLNTERGYDI